MTTKRGEAQARAYTHHDLPGVEAIEVVVYDPDGSTGEVDTTLLQRPHPEVPCSTAERNDELRQIGWNTLGAWSKEGDDTWTVPVVRQKSVS